MRNRNRRAFLADVGQGVIAATIGYSAAFEMGMVRAVADERPPERLTFGPRESLVAFLQETPAERLLPTLVERLRSGTSLDELLAAATLANARAFGGEDYIGFHTFMALAPARHMAGELPAATRALPVLKVLYRNSARIQAAGGAQKDALQPVAAAEPAAGNLGDQIRAAVRDKDLPRAERLLAAAAGQSLEAAYDGILPAVADGVEVHRTVLAYRAWDLLDLVGREHAATLLRQSLHYCIENCKPTYDDRFAGVRALLPRLLDQYRLIERQAGTRVADDAWVESLSQTIFSSSADQAADAVAAALADDMSLDSVADAVSLAANQLILRDPGRPARYAQPNKPVGSVHGDSLGVHGCDSVNAWRNIARVSNRRNSVTSLILSGWQVASDRQMVTGDSILSTPAYPPQEQVERITARQPADLLTELDDAIRHQDQARAAALVHVYGQQDLPARDVQDVLLGYAISEDGALHAEKFYRTTTEEFARARPQFRWRQMVALARVTASECGQPAAGIEEARRLLNI